MQAVIDRIVQYPNRYQLTNVETQEVLGTFDFDEVTGTVQQVGTEIDAELFQTIADDLAARVKLSGGELKDTVVTFSDISGTAANVASGDTSATLWGKVKNWFSRLKALAFKNKVAAGDFEAGAIKNADVAADAAIAQSKVSGLMTDYVASISVSGRTVTYKNKNGVDMGSITTQDTTYGLASQSSNGLMSSTDKTKLDGIESGAQKNTVFGVKGGSESAYRTGNVNITKANIGLGNVDNTSDIDKPVSTATQSAIDTETLTRQNADKILQGNIDTETSERTAADENLQNQIDELDNAAKSLNAVKYTEQTLTEEQKAQARNNIDAASPTGNYPNMTVGNAVKAEQDADGNNIENTYAKQTGYYLNLQVGRSDRSNRAEMAGSATKATYDSDDNNIVDTYVDKASEQVITGRKVFYGDVTPLNVKYETQESGDAFSYAPVTFYDNTDKKLGSVQGQKTGNGTVQAGIDVYNKDGNYAASMGLKWDHSTQKAFPFAPSGQNVVPNGDSSDKIICSEFLQPGLLYANGVNYGYRGKSYDISIMVTFTYDGGSLRVTRSGNVVKIGGWIKNRSALSNGAGYVILLGLPSSKDYIVGSFITASANTCYGRLFMQGNNLLLASNFNDGASDITANTWLSLTAEYIAVE